VRVGAGVRVPAEVRVPVKLCDSSPLAGTS
jgi:hypothetical protein